MAFDLDKFRDRPEWHSYEYDGDVIELEISGEFLTSEIMQATMLLKEVWEQGESVSPREQGEKLEEAFSVLPKALATAIKRWKPVEVEPSEAVFASFSRTAQLNLFMFVVQCVTEKKMILKISESTTQSEAERYPN